MPRPYKARRIAPPMPRIYESDNPVIALINIGMDMTRDKTLTALSHQIDYNFPNLWSVYHGERNMPIWQLWQLCKFIGRSAEDAINYHEAQPPVKKKLTKKQLAEKSAAEAGSGETFSEDDLTFG